MFSTLISPQTYVV